MAVSPGEVFLSELTECSFSLWFAPSVWTGPVVCPFEIAKNVDCEFIALFILLLHRHTCRGSLFLFSLYAFALGGG